MDLPISHLDFPSLPSFTRGYIMAQVSWGTVGQNPKANRRSFAAVSSFGAQRNWWRNGGWGWGWWSGCSVGRHVSLEGGHLYIHIICTYIYIYSTIIYIYIYICIYIYVNIYKRDPCQATFLLEILTKGVAADLSPEFLLGMARLTTLAPPGQGARVPGCGEWSTSNKLGWCYKKTQIYPLVNIQKAMERSTIFHGKISTISTGPFSIAMLVHQRVWHICLI